MLGVMENGSGVIGRSMGSLVWFIGVCSDEFRDKPARAIECLGLSGVISQPYRG